MGGRDRNEARKGVRDGNERKRKHDGKGKKAQIDITPNVYRNNQYFRTLPEVHTPKHLQCSWQFDALSHAGETIYIYI